SRRAIGFMVVCEGALLGLIGGLFGVLGSALFFYLKSFTLGNEGLTLALTPTSMVVITGLLLAVSLGLLASIYPAYKATSRPLVQSLSS
ncbi:MAG: FtsX-like permease family protein, partial [Rubritalea sp.]|uniref:FtsX-like permease family protein n=1 Tax=Rubritalea sp. TaxID=2109375 RepID=UPI003241DD89